MRKSIDCGHYSWMTLRLDPRFPLIWLTPDIIQFGLDRPAARLEGVSVADERMIAALVPGVPESGLLMIARECNGTIRDVDRLVESLGPVILDKPTPAATRTIRVQVDGPGPTSDRLSTLLRDLGFIVHPRPGTGRIDFAVIVAQFAVAPSRYGRWLRQDIPHLPIVFSDAGFSIGPTVVAGRGPCLYCIDLHRTDSDPRWPAVATQLSLRRADTERPLQIADAVHRSARIVSAFFAAEGMHDEVSTSIYVDAQSGAVTTRAHSVHPQCGCRSLQETAMARAAPFC